MKISRWLLVALSFKIVMAALIIGIVGGVHYMRGQEDAGIPWFNNLPDIDSVRGDIASGRYDLNAYNQDGMTGLMVAASVGDVERARLFLDNGADPNMGTLKANIDVAAKAAIGNTALHIACYYGNNNDSGDNVAAEQLVRLLLEHGARANVRNKSGEEPIHYALNIGDIDTRMRVVRMLLEHDANLNALDNAGNSMLHQAGSLNDALWIRMVMSELGSLLNFDVRNNMGYTPQELAWFVGFGDTGNILANKPIPLGTNNVMTTDNLGRTGLMLAVIRGDREFAQSQLARGAQVNAKARGDDDNTPLHYACKSTNPTTFVKMLVDRRADVNSKNKKGDTPLLLVASIAQPTERIPVARVLLANGASVNEANQAGETVLTQAVRNRDIGLVEFLKTVIGPQQQNLIMQARELAKKLKFPDLVAILQ